MFYDVINAGSHLQGDDITATLQKALDRQHNHQLPVCIRGGFYRISKQINTPYRAGWQLLGIGSAIVNKNPGLHGARTILEWDGPDGGIMFTINGTCADIGNFALADREYRWTGPRASVGMQIRYQDGKRGLGAGKHRFKPLHFKGFDYGIQIGDSPGDHNCDELNFEWIRGDNCRKAIYYGLNTMGMGVNIGHIHNKYCPNSILLSAGGHIWLKSSLNFKNTLLKVIKSSARGHGVGKNNGFIRLSHTKIDNQGGNNFTAVDCEVDDQVRVLMDGGLHSRGDFKGVFAKLVGANKLTLRDFTSTFNEIHGKRGAWATPNILLDGCRLWNKNMDKLFKGDLNVRAVNCDDSAGNWIDWDNKSSSNLEQKIKMLEAKIDNLSIEDFYDVESEITTNPIKIKSKLIKK